MIDIIVAVLVLSAYVFLLGFAAVYDVMTRIIPDRISVAMVCIFPVAALYWELGWLRVGAGLGVALIALAVGVVLFFFHAIGGGDVKLIAATSAWFGSSATAFFLFTAIAGGVLAVIWLVAIRLKYLEKLCGPAAKQRGLPYAVAIAAGGLVAAPESQILCVALTVVGLA